MGQVQHTLSENFLRYFDVALALSEERKRQAYDIRYSVYCEEFGYEPADQFPDGLEYDEYDASSLHALVIHKSSGRPAGCVRLVCSAAGDDLLPMEKYCASSLDRAFIDGLNLDRSTICEVSRLAVDGPFRRRAGERVTRFGEVDGLDCSQQERRTFSIIAVASLLAATALGEISGKTNAFAMMEPFLPRLLKRSGMIFQQAGSETDYHGLRAPYFITANSLVDGVRADLRELYVEIHRQLLADFKG